MNIQEIAKKSAAIDGGYTADIILNGTRRDMVFEASEHQHLVYEARSNKNPYQEAYHQALFACLKCAAELADGDRLDLDSDTEARLKHDFEHYIFLGVNRNAPAISPCMD